MRAGAATNAPMMGGYTVTAIPPGAVPVQLVTGTDGTVWFLTAQSQLGFVTSRGQPALTGVSFPHSSQPAVLVSAGPEGEWAFANGAGPGGECVVALAEPGGHVLQRILNHPPNPTCGSGAGDRVGDLWVSLHGGTSSGMGEITPAGVITVAQAPLLTPPPAVALGSDGAIWTVERFASSPNFVYRYGRFVPGGGVTTIPVSGTDTPPVPGSPFALLLRPGRDPLLARPDGTFWVDRGQNVGLSSPGHWFISFVFPGLLVGAETPDGALWNVGAAGTGTTERIERIDAWGVVDHGPQLPLSTRNGAPLQATGPMTALPDGSLLFVAGDGGADFMVRYVPTQIPPESVWTGSAGDGRWSTPSNWLNGAVPHNGSVVVLRGSAAITDDLAPLQLPEILGYGTVHVSGGPLSMGIEGIQVTGYQTNIVISNSMTTAAGTSLTLRAGPFATLTVNGVISGAGGVTSGGASNGFRSSGLVVLTADNTYTGTTAVVNSPLRIDGHQPGSPVIVGSAAQLVGGGTTGAVEVTGTGSIDFADEAAFYGHCPQTLTVDGNLVFDAGSTLFSAVQACGTPSVQTVGAVLVTGSATISAGVDFRLSLIGDRPQVACLLSSQGPLHGQFVGVKEGSTQPDPSGGHVVFSYRTPGGAGCFPNAFTATTGVH